MLTALTPEERTDLLLSVGSHRKNRRRTPIGVAELIHKASQRQSLRDIADYLELKDDSMLHRFLSLRKLPQEIQDLVSWGDTPGTISFTAATEISRLNQQADRETLVRATLEHRLTKQEVKAVLQRNTRGNISIKAAIDEIIKLRPIVDQQHLFMGILAPEFSSNLEETQVRQILRKQLATLIGGSEVISISCRSGRFSILLTDQGAAHPKVKDYLQPERLEGFVASLVRLGVEDSNGACS